MKNLKQVFRLLLLTIFFWFIGHSILIIIDGLNDNHKNADIALILGNKVNKDGTLSKRLEKRLACGLNLYRQKRIKKIIVSGGLGKEGFYEGDKMRDYLIKNNIPAKAIIVDNFGNNTMASIENTLKLKDSLKFKSIIVVSQYFHVSRTKMLFKQKGFKNLSSVSPKYFEWRDFYAITREFFAYYSE